MRREAGVRECARTIPAHDNRSLALLGFSAIGAQRWKVVEPIRRLIAGVLQNPD
jgi:hypothetical protein